LKIHLATDTTRTKGHADVGAVQIIKYNKHWRLSERLRLQKCPNRDLQHMTTKSDDATADASCFFVGDAMRQSRKTTILAATVPGCNCNGSSSSSTAATSACPTMHAKQSQLLLLCGDVAAVLLLMLPQMMATTSSASRDQDEDWDVDVALCVANRLLLLPRI